MGPEGLALGTGEDRRIAAAAVISARSREGNQQVAIDWIDIGVFGPGAVQPSLHCRWHGPDPQRLQQLATLERGAVHG